MGSDTQASEPPRVRARKLIEELAQTPKIRGDRIFPEAHDPRRFRRAVETPLSWKGLPSDRAAELMIAICSVLQRFSVTMFAYDLQRKKQPKELGRLKRNASLAKNHLAPVKRRAQPALRRMERGTADNDDVKSIAKFLSRQTRIASPERFNRVRRKRIFGKSSDSTREVLHAEIVDPILKLIVDSVNANKTSASRKMSMLPSERAIARVVVAISSAYLPPDATMGLKEDAVRKRIHRPTKKQKS